MKQDKIKRNFPTTDEEMKEFLATMKPVKLPEKYETPDWLFEQNHGTPSRTTARQSRHGLGGYLTLWLNKVFLTRRTNDTKSCKLRLRIARNQLSKMWL